jgi:PIN domain nuclease of toxin-antitoxin system
MNYLLDTHTLIWILITPKKLPTKVSELMSRAKSVYVSTISLWEISLKYSLNKLELKGVIPEEIPDYVERTGFQIVTINPEIASTFYKLPRLHKDPFDRMLVWQAIKGNYTLVSSDKELKEYEKYGLSVVW